MSRLMRLGFKKNKPGFNHWWAQRLSAVVLAITSIWLLVLLLQDHPFAYDAGCLWFQSPWHYSLSLIFVLSLSIHFYFGLEKIMNDYVHDEALHKVFLRLIMIGICIAAVGGVGVLTMLLVGV